MWLDHLLSRVLHRNLCKIKYVSLAAHVITSPLFIDTFRMHSPIIAVLGKQQLKQQHSIIEVSGIALILLCVYSKVRIIQKILLIKFELTRFDYANCVTRIVEKKFKSD